MLAPYVMIIMLSVFLVANSAIGLQLYSTTKTGQDRNWSFLVASVILGVLGILSSSFGIYLNRNK
jgi:uncharacterized membrane protein YjjB (DUF3815 family)